MVSFCDDCGDVQFGDSDSEKESYVLVSFSGFRGTLRRIVGRFTDTLDAPSFRASLWVRLTSVASFRCPDSGPTYFSSFKMVMIIRDVLKEEFGATYVLSGETDYDYCLLTWN